MTCALDPSNITCTFVKNGTARIIVFFIRPNPLRDNHAGAEPDTIIYHPLHISKRLKQENSKIVLIPDKTDGKTVSIVVVVPAHARMVEAQAPLPGAIGTALGRGPEAGLHAQNTHAV